MSATVGSDGALIERMVWATDNKRRYKMLGRGARRRGDESTRKGDGVCARLEEPDEEMEVIQKEEEMGAQGRAEVLAVV